MTVIARLYKWQYAARQWLVGTHYRLQKRDRKAACGFETIESLAPRNILMVVSGMIGDTVMSTPALIEARRLWPHAQIVVLGQAHNCELLGDCPYVDSFKEISALPFSIGRRREVESLKHWLRAQHFDIAFVVLGNQFASLLASCEIPVRVGTRGHFLTPCLTHSIDAGTARTWGPAEILNLLRSLEVEVHECSPQIWVSEQTRAQARQRMKHLGIDAGDSIVAVHPFGSTLRQRWPVERVVELADRIHELIGARTLLIGGSEFRDQAAALPASPRLINAIGELSIRQSLAALEAASLVVSTDSGPFHMAGALGRPLVGLFRASRPEHARHYAQSRIVFGRHPSCEGRCRWDRCEANLCRQMNALGIDDVLAAMREAPIAATTRSGGS